MSNYNSLKATIDANIKQNGNQEITGQILNSVLNQMVTTLGAGYQFGGVATTATNPGTPDAQMFYIANGKGTYTNFGGIEVTEDDVVVLFYDTSWHKVATGIASQDKLTELEETVDNTTYKHNNLVNLNDIVSGEWISPTWGTINQDNNSYHTNKIPVKAGQVLWFTECEKLVCYNNVIQYKGSPSSEGSLSALNPWNVPDGVTEIIVHGTYNSQHIINKIYISVGGEKAVQEEYGYFTKTSDGIVENGELPVKAGDVYANGGGTFNSGEKVRELTIESSVSQTNNINKIPNSNAVNIGLNNIAPYFICETAGDVAAKVVDAPGFVLRNGGSIKIKMSNVNTADSVTLNINNTGAKALHYRGMRAGNSYSWIANEIIEVVYDGSGYYARPFTNGFQTIEDFDISAYNAKDGVPAKYETLEDALAAVPGLYRRGGMSVKYLPTEGDYYVRYRLDYKNWTSLIRNWYGIEDIPTENSKGIITSGGVFNALKPINVNVESIKGWNKTVTKTFVNNNAQLYIKDIRIPANTPFKVKVSSSDAVWTQLFIFGNSLTIYGEWDTTVDNGVEKEIIVPVEVTTISVFPRYYTSLGDITLEVTYDGDIKNITDNLQKQIDEIDLSSIQSQIDTLNTKVDAEVENPELLLSENDSEGRALRTISKDSETHYIPQKFEERITLSKKAYEGLIQSMRSYEIPEVMEIELGEPEVAISTQDEDVSIYDDLDFDYSKVLKISDNMYYMYYHAWGSGTTVPYAIDNTKLVYTTLFAHSTDGINWTRGFPEGVTPPYETYPHSVKFLNERGTPTYEPATNVFIVHDSEYPFRCITSEGSSKIYKSRDGFTFEQPKLIEYNQVRDTQPGVVLRGDVCKIYGRGWTGGYPTTHPESGYGSRNIIVFYADYNGNLMCQEIPVVEGKYYNNAAFAIDDHREMIIPTFFEDDNIPIRFDAYIIDGRRITQVNIDSDKMLANGTYKWGTVAPCIIATGGKTYIYYNVVTVSHNQSATSASRVCNMMRIEIKFKSNSLKYKI